MSSADDGRVAFARVLTDPVKLLAFGFGAGCVTPASGTFGTLAAVPIYLFLAQFNPAVYGLSVLILFGVGVWICGKVSTALGVHDHPGIVWDEIVGYLVTMFMAPAGWRWTLLGFALFRLFDIWKPFPIRALERRCRGGFGVMIDDVAAALYAALVLQALRFILGPG